MLQRADKPSENPPTLHIICERDVGLFNLILSVIPQVDWALSEGRFPIVYYGEGNCYWTPNGYRDRDTVWEYYFEPVLAGHPASSIPSHIRSPISANPPDRSKLGYFADPSAFVTNAPTGYIPFEGERIRNDRDPSLRLRQKASAIIRDYIRPRPYILSKAEQFFRAHLADRYVIGIHIRGTDSLVDPDRVFGQNIDYEKYFAIAERLLLSQPMAKIFVASDAQTSVDRMRERFGERVIAYDSIRQGDGELAARGPKGGLMPTYLTEDRDRAAQSGEEAVIEYLLLCRCDHLVHNGSSLPQAVLLTVPELPASDTISTRSHLRHAERVWRRRLDLVRNTISGKPIAIWHRLLHELWITKRAARREASRRA